MNLAGIHYDDGQTILQRNIMTKKYRKKRIKDIARQQIQRLFELAESISVMRPESSDRYVHLAKQIGMRNRVRIPAHLKRRMCRHCEKYLVPGRTCRVRLNGTNVVVTCLACGRQMRYPYHGNDHPSNEERE